MKLPSRSLLRLRYEYARGDRAAIDHAMQMRTVADPEGDLAAAAEASLVLGALAADVGQYLDALTLLQEGLETAAQTERDLFAGDLDRFELLRLALAIRVGDYGLAGSLVPALVEPERDLETRLHATRAHASLATIHGSFESAHHLLNTAGDIAHRTNSRFRSTLVDGDRAIVLATQGRLGEAIGMADRCLAHLVRPPVGPMQRWSNQQAATVAVTVSRIVVTTGDLLTSQRLLSPAAIAAERAADPFVDAHLALARAVFRSAEGITAEAEEEFTIARSGFEALGCEPGVALTMLEQGRAAGWRGLQHTAEPLLRSALATFRHLGHPRECAEIASLLGVRQGVAPAIEGP